MSKPLNAIELGILIDFYWNADAWYNISSNSESMTNAISRLRLAGMITEPSSARDTTITEKGKFYVDYLKSIAYPVEKKSFVIPMS